MIAKYTIVTLYIVYTSVCTVSNCCIWGIPKNYLFYYPVLRTCFIIQYILTCEFNHSTLYVRINCHPISDVVLIQSVDGVVYSNHWLVAISWWIHDNWSLVWSGNAVLKFYMVQTDHRGCTAIIFYSANLASVGLLTWIKCIQGLSCIGNLVWLIF